MAADNDRQLLLQKMFRWKAAQEDPEQVYRVLVTRADEGN